MAVLPKPLTDMVQVRSSATLLVFLVTTFLLADGQRFGQNVFDLSVRKAPRWHFPLLGYGPSCNGCPPRSCEDDRAIVVGYCCGCARPLDKLPVICPHGLICPLNGKGLCHDYEYMMYCCC